MTPKRKSTPSSHQPRSQEVSGQAKQIRTEATCLCLFQQPHSSIEVYLPHKVYDPSFASLEAFLSLTHLSRINVIKSSLVMELVLPRHGLKLEKTVISSCKVRPFMIAREVLALDLDCYRESVDLAKREFMLVQDFCGNMVMNDNPIKTLNVKRAKKNKEEEEKELKNSFFRKKGLACLALATCEDGHLLHSSYRLEIHIET